MKWISFYNTRAWSSPIEVKSNTTISSPSLKAIKRFHGEEFPLRIRYSFDGDILTIPLFMADWSERLITRALERLL